MTFHGTNAYPGHRSSSGGREGTRATPTALFDDSSMSVRERVEARERDRDRDRDSERDFSSGNRGGLFNTLSTILNVVIL